MIAARKIHICAITTKACIAKLLQGRINVRPIGCIVTHL